MESKKEVFVVMPFSATATCTEAEWTEIYENVFKPSIEECGYSCERAKPMTGSLTKSIIENLRYSWIVLADITDRNANVFYELGVRHSLSKRTIVVAQGDHHTPSDLLGYWYLSYGTSPGRVIQFKNEIKRLLTEIESAPDKSDNPVSDYLEQENLNISSYIQTENIKKLGGLYTEFTGNIIQLSALVENKATEIFISFDCLRLLLQTLYIDIGPALLKLAYELSYRLRRIETGYKDEKFIRRTIQGLKTLSNEIFAIRIKLIRGQYREPSTISTMVWRSDIVDQGLIMLDDAIDNSFDETIIQPILSKVMIDLASNSLMGSVCVSVDRSTRRLFLPSDDLLEKIPDFRENAQDLSEVLEKVSHRGVQTKARTQLNPVPRKGKATRPLKDKPSVIAKKKKLRTPKNKGG